VGQGLHDQRLQYRISRHPLTFALAYLTVFLFSITLLPLLQNARRHWDSAVAIAAHATLIAMLWIFAGFLVVLHTCLLPMLLAAALGAYLFYAQHNYVGMNVLSAEQWGFHEPRSSRRATCARPHHAAVHGEHRLSPRAPPEPAHPVLPAAGGDGEVPEFQRAAVTTLSPRDVFACLRSRCGTRQPEMLGFREATAGRAPGPGPPSRPGRGARRPTAPARGPAR
jgi:omega-6 fatty acid desaturase (delta-12 desaturase)